MPAWLGAAVGVVALLAAAKAHGRQVRLEREAAGYRDVSFGGENPPFVTRLWRADRVRFWLFVPVAALAFGAAAWLARAEPALVALAALVWAPTGGFFFAGLASLARQRGRGGAGWWSAATLLALLSIALALL